jgi:hypothetical protein
MEYEYKSKIIVVGPPSTGSTGLIELFHWLGIDTGFKDSTVEKVSSSESAKGLEWIVSPNYRRMWKRRRREENFDASPEVIKRPISHGLKGKGTRKSLIYKYREYGWDIRHVIFTVRNYSDYVDSQYRSKLRRGRKYNEESFKLMINTHMLGTYRILYDCARFEYPFTLLEYPKWCQDKGYCRRVLETVLDAKQLQKFDEAYAKTVDPDKIHFANENAGN